MRVEFQHTLTASREDLPTVLSTPRMIAWMEGAAFEAMLPFCEGDEVSVGTAVNIIHRAGAGVGDTVKCEAVLEEFDNRFYAFRVTAHDGAEVIGHGTVKRAIVSKSKLDAKLRAKQAGKA
jgi:fluoroacetyl-CoA thioesterase